MSEIQTYPKVTIIILYLKNIRCLIDCIISLNKISYENFDIFIVHNGPKSKVLEKNLALISQHITEVIDTGENVGFAMGNNIGIKQALQKGAEYILLLNDDTVVSADFLNILVDAGEKNSDVGMLGPKIYYFDEPQRTWFAGAKFDEQTGLIFTPLDSKHLTGFTPHSNEIDNNRKDEKPEESDYITGCALLVKRKLIEKIGLLDERFFLYWEDVDWGLRSKKANFKSVVVPSSKIWHKISLSSGGQNSPLRVYHKTRSHFLLVKLHTLNLKSKLMLRFMRDIVWLLFKSSDPDKIKKVRAYFAATIDYHLGKTGRGPHWLWVDN